MRSDFNLVQLIVWALFEPIKNEANFSYLHKLYSLLTFVYCLLNFQP